MQSVLIFCGASTGDHPIYKEVAEQVGTILAQEGYQIVFGAGSVGLMGIIADAALAAGGQVVGVITEHLVELEVCHRGLTELHVVPTMHERKVMMAKLSDAVLTLPGGYGTLDELFELATLGQLGEDKRPIGILNTAGFFSHLLAYLDHVQQEGFLRAHHRDLLLVEESIDLLLPRMASYATHTDVPKWL